MSQSGSHHETHNSPHANHVQTSDLTESSEAFESQGSHSDNPTTDVQQANDPTSPDTMTLTAVQVLRNTIQRPAPLSPKANTTGLGPSPSLNPRLSPVFSSSDEDDDTPLLGNSSSGNKRGIYTGEYRTPFRERLQRLRGAVSKGYQPIPRPTAGIQARPDTPIPATPRRNNSKRDRSASPITPRTPPQQLMPSVPECPGAPRKVRRHPVFDLRHEENEDEEDEEDDDILLDRRGHADTYGTMDPAAARALMNTAGRNSPLRQSWSPDQLAEIDETLRAWLKGEGEPGVEGREEEEGGSKVLERLADGSA